MDDTRNGRDDDGGSEVVGAALVGSTELGVEERGGLLSARLSDGSPSSGEDRGHQLGIANVSNERP